MKNNKTFIESVGLFLKNNWHILVTSLILAVVTVLAVGYVS